MRCLSSKRCLAVVPLIVSLLIAAGCGGSQNAAADYPSKDIEFIVGVGAGGGYDTWARTLAPFLEEYLPGDHKVVVRNMEGSGGAKAAEALMNAGIDGHMLEIINVAGLAGTQVVEEVGYDLNKFTWVGRLNLDVNTMYVAPTSKYQSLDDMKNAKEPVLFSARGLTGSSTIAAAVLFNELGIEWEPLNHDSAGEAVLAVVRGDADVIIRTFNSGRDAMASGDLLPIGYFDSKPHPEFPDIPTADELGVPFMANLMSSYVLAMPPDTDAGAAEAMEEAIKKAVEDPEFLAAIEKLEYELSYLSGEDTANLVKDLMETYVQYEEPIQALFN